MRYSLPLYLTLRGRRVHRHEDERRREQERHRGLRRCIRRCSRVSRRRRKKRRKVRTLQRLAVGRGDKAVIVPAGFPAQRDLSQRIERARLLELEEGVRERG